jgi:MFS family permease
MATTTPNIPPASPSGPSGWPSRIPFFYGWVILASATLGMFASGPGQTYSASVFLDPMLEDLGWSRTLASGLYTAGSLTAAVCVVMVGRLLDRYGARIMLTVVGIAFGVALLWMSTVSHPVQLYIGYAAIRTLGQGSMMLIPTTLVAMWFVRLRGRATALTALGTAGGQMAFPLLIHFFIDDYGWRGAWIALAIVVWIIVLPIAVILVRRSPESIGVLPDGDTMPVVDPQAKPASARRYTEFLASPLRRVIAVIDWHSPGLSFDLLLPDPWHWRRGSGSNPQHHGPSGAAIHVYFWLSVR